VEGYSLVVCVGQPMPEARRVGGLCRAAGVKFMAGRCQGALGWYFLDLLSHEYVTERSIPGQPDREVGSRGEGRGGRRGGALARGPGGAGWGPETRARGSGVPAPPAGGGGTRAPRAGGVEAPRLPPPVGDAPGGGDAGRGPLPLPPSASRHLAPAPPPPRR